MERIREENAGTEKRSLIFYALGTLFKIKSLV